MFFLQLNCFQTARVYSPGLAQFLNGFTFEKITSRSLPFQITLTRHDGLAVHLPIVHGERCLWCPYSRTIFCVTSFEYSSTMAPKARSRGEFTVICC